MIEFFDVTHVHSARKSHTCECCGKTINPGDPYYKESGKFDGEFFSRCMCPVCHGIEMDYCSEVDNVFDWDDLREYARNAVCDNCQYGDWNEDSNDYIMCSYDCIQDCPKISEKFMPKEKQYEIM